MNIRCWWGSEDLSMTSKPTLALCKSSALWKQIWPSLSAYFVSSHSVFTLLLLRVHGDIFLSRFSCVSSQHIMLQICDVGVVLRIGWNENSRVDIRVHTVDFPHCEDRGEEVWGYTDWKAEVREVAMNQSSRTFTLLQHFQKTVGEESNYNSI